MGDHDLTVLSYPLKAIDLIRMILVRCSEIENIPRMSGCCITNTLTTLVHSA